jgi:Peptidase family S41
MVFWPLTEEKWRMTRLNRRRLIGSGCAAACFGAIGTSALLAAERSNTPKTLSDDIVILREALTSLHPGLYRYLSPHQAEASISAFERAYVSAPDQATRYLELSRFLAMIRCGHSYANFYNQKKAVREDLFDRNTRLPFGFHWIDGAMIITADHGSGAKLERGTEVLEINGVHAAGMLAQLMPYVRADGHNDGKRRALLSVTSGSEFETFDIFHGLVFAAPVGGMHRLKVGAPDGVIRSVAVPAISLADRQKFRITDPIKSDQPLWQWDMRADGIAVLTMNDWGTYDIKWDWKSWLTERLDALKGARGFIVDIRANEGGEDCGDEIIARFEKADLPLSKERRLVRYRTTSKALDPYLDTWDDSFRTLGVDAETHDARFFRLERTDSEQLIAARGPRINLPMAVLIGPQNSSATFQFAARCRQAGIATLIGEPSGGNQRGINGGCFFFVRLPASGLEFDLPLIGFFPTKPMPDAGLMPDLLVRQSARDIAEERDTAMEAATTLLSRHS